MRFETAKALRWPWETKHSLYVLKYGDIYMSDERMPMIQVADTAPCPSVEEMLERMPPDIVRKGYVKDLTICKFDEGLPGHFYSVGYRGSSGGYGHAVSFRGVDLSELLALLCIWLRDNGLMEWPEEGKR